MSDVTGCLGTVKTILWTGPTVEFTYDDAPDVVVKLNEYDEVFVIRECRVQKIEAHEIFENDRILCISEWNAGTMSKNLF